MGDESQFFLFATLVSQALISATCASAKNSFAFGHHFG
jgi:hypothetical protein